MGLQEVLFMARRCRRYQRLRGNDDGEEVLAGDGEKPAAGRWVRTSSWRLRRRRAGKAVLRMSRRRAGVSGGIKIKAALMRLLLLVPARRAAALLRRIAIAGAECPAIVFSSQWGLPVLSPSASVGGAAQLRAFYLQRTLSAASSSTAGGSPC